MQVKSISLVSAIIISLGIVGAGYSIGQGLYLAKKQTRTVSVKGLAERDVKADLGVWEIPYREVGNDLTALNQKLQQDAEAVLAFLKQKGFDAAELSRLTIRVEDRMANVYSQNTNNNANEQRYIVTGGIKVRTAKVDAIEAALPATDQLLQQGIPLALDASNMSPNPSYYFTKIDAIRPEMLAQATKSARMVANQFAKDSESHLGGIVHANQGQYQILSRDSSSESETRYIDKKVRLVSSIDYALNN